MPIDDNILKDDIKIKSVKDRDFILLQINKDVKYILKKSEKIRNSSLQNEIVINTDKMILTGNKMHNKIYRHHSGYIGGMKEVPAKVMLEKNPEKAMTLAIKGMLPHNSLGKQSLKKLRVYAGAEHENKDQKPEVWEVRK